MFYFVKCLLGVNIFLLILIAFCFNKRTASCIILRRSTLVRNKDECRYLQKSSWILLRLPTPPSVMHFSVSIWFILSVSVAFLSLDFLIAHNPRFLYIACTFVRHVSWPSFVSTLIADTFCSSYDANSFSFLNS